jgi:hypothetical protein
MVEPALSEELIEQWSDRKWRLNNLYWIEDKYGQVIPFNLNAAQEQLLEELHYLNIILKARQLGFSTFILILALDCAVFNDHFAAGLVADTIDNAKNLLKRVKFAYDRLPPEIQKQVTVKTANATEVEFSNGSAVVTGVSLRSGTFNLVHISEYGKICAKYPDKAKEIKAGALNTIAPGQLVFIESTAEGRDGDFYDKTQAAQAIHDSGREPKEQEYKFHFFPWWMDPTYQAKDLYHLTNEDVEYFKELEDFGITLTDGQKWWYAGKKREQGDDMWKEFPSTPEEAFKAAKDGAYFAKEIRNLRQLKRIGPFPFDPAFPVNTFWDWGLNDSTTIWLHQQIAGRNRFVGFYENSGEGPAHYADWLDRWRAMRSARFGEHYGPHDWDHRRPGSRGEITSLREIFRSLGYEFKVVDRCVQKRDSIQNVRSKLPSCEFDEAECEAGILHMENYSRDWDEKFGVWKSTPRHDDHSHCADGFMTFADGYAPDTPLQRRRSRAKNESWLTA